MANCDHNWVYQSETSTTVTHKCSRCGETSTRAKGSRLLAVLFLVMVAVCVLATIVAGTPA